MPIASESAFRLMTFPHSLKKTRLRSCWDWRAPISQFCFFALTLHACKSSPLLIVEEMDFVCDSFQNVCSAVSGLGVGWLGGLTRLLPCLGMQRSRNLRRLRRLRRRCAI